MPNFGVEELKKKFPNLYRELSSKDMHIRIDAIRDSEDRAEESMRILQGGLPGPVDYIRRCDMDEEALELIDYLEKRGEVDRQEAERLRVQVREKGVRSFGSKKELGYYSRFIR